ncbi:MAG TPA: nucleotide exchange factor GrpE, partial [Synergistaceae bacterium]|nr:nucleotide exchange factor GrpE [Synergistaceae bacterium]
MDEKAHAGKDKSSDEPKKHHSAREKSDHKKNKDKDNEDLKDRLLRLQADFDNFRKRVVREKNEIYQRANENIMEELLPVLDHLDLALEACSVEDSSRALFE